MMTVWIVYVFTIVVIIFVLSFVSSMFAVNEKTSSNPELYECGIETLQIDKVPFYMHFYVIGILFLLFDVELIVCIPLTWMSIYEKMWGVMWFIFFFILFFGLILEFTMGTLDWKD